MSNHFVQSNDCGVMPGQSIYPCQSDWMAHWTRKIKDNNGCSTGQHPVHGELDKASVISDGQAAESMNKSLGTSSKSLGSERFEFQPFTTFGLLRNKDIISASGANQTNITQSHEKCENDWDSGNFASTGNESRFPFVVACPPPETKSLFGDSTLQSREQQVKCHNFFEKNLALSRSSQDNFMGSSVNAIPYGFNSEKKSMLSFMHAKDISHSSSAMESGDCSVKANLVHLQHGQYQHCTTYVIHQEKINDHLELGKSGMSLRKEKGILMGDSSHSNTQFPGFLGKQFLKSDNCSAVGFFPSQSNTSQASETGELYHQYSSAQGTPFLPYVENMRLSPLLDSMNDVSPAAPTKFSQAPHSFFIGKNSDFDLSKGSQIVNKSSVCTKFKGNMVCEFLSLSSDIDLHNPLGVKLQSIGNSTGTVGKGNVEHVKCTATLVELRNELSADTDTMHKDHFREQNNPSTSVASSAPCKDLGQIASTSQDFNCLYRKEVEDRMRNNDAPDLNQEHPELPTGPSSKDVKEPSASRTDSLAVEQFLCHSVQLARAKSNTCPASSKESDLNSKWVKRLKLSPADSFHHSTKSARIEEVLFPRKLRKLFSESDSDPNTGREPMILDHTAVFCKKGESASMDLGKIGTDARLSYSWIQRWCKKSKPFLLKKKREIGLCETGSSKMVPKKDYPSIAAMALVGKAMSGLRPRYFQYRGSLISWSFEKVS